MSSLLPPAPSPPSPFQVLLPDLGPASVYEALEKDPQLSTVVRGVVTHSHVHTSAQTHRPTVRGCLPIYAAPILAHLQTRMCALP
jgi:hypothetical protein